MVGWEVVIVGLKQGRIADNGDVDCMDSDGRWLVCDGGVGGGDDGDDDDDDDGDDADAEVANKENGNIPAVSKPRLLLLCGKRILGTPPQSTPQLLSTP